jgi:hypothetical protein
VKIDSGRYEVKYAVPTDVRERILEVAGANMVADPHGTPLPGGGKGYIVHSTYYDTDDLIDYTSRLCDQRVRRRMRVRTYGERGQKQPVFLELKRKLDNQVIKQRALVCDADEWETLGDTPWDVLAQRGSVEARGVAARFGMIIRDLGLKPVTSVHYEREVYCDARAAHTQVRLTIDRVITASIRPPVHDLYPKPDIALIPADWSVLELKFDRDQPGWMRQLARELSLRAECVSKFGLSVALGLRADHPREVNRLTPYSIRKAVA